MPAGRPTKLTPAVQKQIAECFFDGLTDEETASVCDMDRRTITRMRSGEYCPNIKKAENGKIRFYVKKLRDGTRPDWPRIAWFLERRYPNRFSKPEIQLQVNNDNRSIHQTLVIQAEVAGQINDRVKSAKSKVTELLKEKRPGSHQSNGHAKAPDA